MTPQYCQLWRDIRKLDHDIEAQRGIFDQFATMEGIIPTGKKTLPQDLAQTN